MASYLKAAASYLDRSNISSSYTAVPNPSTILSTSSSSISTLPSAGQPSSSSATTNYAPSVRIGLWTVTRATHNSTNKLVSVWTFEKKLDQNSNHSYLSGRGSNTSTTRTPLEKVIDVLKKEASSLSRLRHPCILEVVEPLEETRTTMVFATEPVTACLKDAINHTSNSRSSPSLHPYRNSNSHQSQSVIELDEVETQKGLLQIGKGLQFLHESAGLVHSNLTPDAIIINAKGDWKISGFGLSQYLKQPDGQDTRWSFPDCDPRLPAAVQKNYDYIAAEYALDEQLTTSNDMYSLGCILHFIHTKSGPPFYNEGDLDRMRRNVENMGVLRAAWARVPDDVQDVLSQLITRYPSTRLTASSFLTSRYFSSNVLVSTLAFLDRDTFNSKQKEEQIQFMKGLTRILPQFSDKIIRRKILPSLIEETRKHILLPFLLPNIFYIGQKMDNDAFREELLPHLTPLFSIKDPPQSILTLLDNLAIFQTKSTPQVFREQIMPLIYFALESDVPALQEKSLRVIPTLCETLDYTHVKQVLFPKVTMIFSKTTLLSIKVNTLICFHSMVKILDKFTLTEKLVPLLARIKTKEPAVMIATLAVHEEMGKKVELTAIATLILPQLWAMSIGPLLNLDQFKRFMNSIDQLSKRVREEHAQHLLEAKRLQESTTNIQQLSQSAGNHGEVDFETLVKGAGHTKSAVTASNGTRQTTSDQIEYDGFASPSDANNTSPTFSAWGFDDTAPNLQSNARPGIGSSSAWNSNTTSKQNASQSSTISRGSLTHPIPRVTSTASSSSSMAPLNQMSNSTMMNLMKPPTHPASQVPPRPSSANTGLSSTSYSFSKPSVPSLGTSTGNGMNTFIGLPPLQPQSSSLSEIVQTSTHQFNARVNGVTMGSSINWNIIPPSKPQSNQPTNKTNRVELSDFDPFA
ncbi:kinase-like domain-containing protein [Melampsora americana]|nr:kinase-like domain-containing protein [Melampsora americana]